MPSVLSERSPGFGTLVGRAGCFPGDRLQVPNSRGRMHRVSLRRTALGSQPRSAADGRTAGCGHQRAAPGRAPPCVRGPRAPGPSAAGVLVPAVRGMSCRTQVGCEAPGLSRGRGCRGARRAWYSASHAQGEADAARLRHPSVAHRALLHPPPHLHSKSWWHSCAFLSPSASLAQGHALQWGHGGQRIAGGECRLSFLPWHLVCSAPSHAFALFLMSHCCILPVGPGAFLWLGNAGELGWQWGE